MAWFLKGLGLFGILVAGLPAYCQSLDDAKSEFIQKIAVCSTELDVSLDIDDLVGSADSLFSGTVGEQADGTATLTISGFLSLFSTDDAKVTALRIYTECLKDNYPRVSGTDSIIIGTTTRTGYSETIQLVVGKENVVNGFYDGSSGSEIKVLISNPIICKLRFFSGPENEVGFAQELEVVGGRFVYRNRYMHQVNERTLPAGDYVLHFRNFKHAGFYSFVIDARAC